MKPGWKTTEFYMSIATALWGALAPALPSWAHAVVPAVASAAYAIGRAVTKRGAAPAQANVVSVGNP